ncbi:MAG TPA: indolepyruvate ferredoxin oxidoreductase family protein [Alphaproteobacteria bacterium]|nr:indolepyruvate ferredoxin oxidoreductase family protein [Alphaproteobacteria bacterium]
MALATVSLDDKYTVSSGRVFMTGIQALVRLPMMQHERDRAAGLNTAGFISGYRGSPLGGFDQQLWKAKKFLAEHDIEFKPGVNEDLGATAVWGSQQVGLFPGAKYDGVFALWYGKGPGVDRTGDVFKHANAAGTARHGGVLALAGDDHACKSSTFPHQSEHAFVAAMMPVLHPAGIQEIIDYGLIGWAMSRYSGLWVAMKVIAETVDSSGSVSIDPHRVNLVMPTDFEMPPGGLSIRWPDPPLEQEHRLMRQKLYAALAFARANRIDRVVMDSPVRRFGIVTTGKAYLDVRQALDDLHIDDNRAAQLGITVYKVGMPWPLEREGARHFCEGLQEVVVVEEKRAVIENQLKEQLYNWHADVRPRVVGKFDENGEWILPSAGELSPAQIAVVLGKRLLKFQHDDHIAERVAFLEAQERRRTTIKSAVERKPTFCSGCPHNTSTKVPEGSRAVGGIGCHYMATWMDRRTDTFTQMGGEGVPWIGQAPFTKTKHIFANLGDGTYFHSGLLAIRASIAAGTNITYKLLYNDAVAMTGGQPVEGTLSVPQIVDQLRAEGVKRIEVVTDDLDRYDGVSLPVRLHHRDDMDKIQRELREVEGCTVIVYDQTCAAEKRRRRKRGLMADPNKRVLINEQVCEACGDCSVKSNCVSVVPVETEFGRKRQIDQSSCNKDYSCVNGFCPSFVTVEGGTLKKRRGSGGGAFGELPEPQRPALGQPYNILVTGVGGTGVVTIGALLGAAAHVEGKGCSVLDMTGLAQKGGPVTSHVRIAEKPEDIHAVRIAAGGAHAVLGCDMIVAAGGDALSKMTAGETRVVLNSFETITSEFTRNPDHRIPAADMIATVRRVVGEDHVDVVDATGIATALLGDSLATNLFMLGFAYQKGLVPLSADAINAAIELNGAAVKMNQQAFLWGRRAAHMPAEVAAAAKPQEAAMPHRQLSASLDEVIARREAFLVDYQDAAYAARYRRMVDRVRAAEAEKAPGLTGLGEAVAHSLHRLMAYKDEYEVARLYTDGTFQRLLNETFEGDVKLTFHLAPPMIAERDEATGHAKKRTFGPWMLKAFGVLARLKRLRGGPLDVFGYTEERRMERRLIGEYEAILEELIRGLTHDNHALAVEIAKLPQQMRGYGHIKEANVAKAKARQDELLSLFRAPPAQRTAAE